MVRKVKFLVNGALLTATTLISRTMGLVFRVYMTNTIGTEGIGLYQLILTVYMFFVTVSTGGISLAVTRLTTDALAEGNVARAKKITNICCVIALLLSTALCALLFFGAEFIGNVILKDQRAVLSLKILAPSLPFMGVSACYRGYFYARRTVIKTASEQLIEQIIEMGIFALLISTMAPMGIAYACAAVVIGSTVSEFLTFFYSYGLYKADIKKQLKAHPIKKAIVDYNAVKSIFVIGIPVTISSSLRSGLCMLENILIPFGLKANGASYSAALSDYGIITGLVFPVIAFPAVFLCSYSMVLIPELSEARAQTRLNSIRYMTEKVLRFSLIFAIPVSVLLFFFADTFGSIILGSDTVSGYLCIFAPIVPLIYIDCVVDGMLKGLNEQVHYLAYNIIDAVLRVALIYFLLPIYGIRGLIAVMFASAILNGTLCLMRLIKVTKISVNIWDYICKPLVAILLPCFMFSIFANINVIELTNAKGIIAVILCVVCYLFLLFVMGVISKPTLSNKIVTTPTPKA